MKGLRGSIIYKCVCFGLRTGTVHTSRTRTNRASLIAQIMFPTDLVPWRLLCEVIFTRGVAISTGRHEAHTSDGAVKYKALPLPDVSVSVDDCPLQLGAYVRARDPPSSFSAAVLRGHGGRTGLREGVLKQRRGWTAPGW